ncbi:alpha/beta fold hydrolase [Legionella sp. CNM-1927-20]|uniref:alpha/beta fold hydrolase n=1 Tax=Legionella sp. CNM-1927-20 TaxID=3422221 RepID=UPI00403B01A2
MFNAIEVPICLIRAKQGVFYPEDVFHSRLQCLRDLTVYEICGGHHVHMDNPVPVANLIANFFNFKFKI